MSRAPSSEFADRVLAMGGPYFAAYWKYPSSREWSSEAFRLFGNAKARLEEEKSVGAVMGYVSHVITDEAVWSFGAIENA